MSRKTFSQILDDCNFDSNVEYERLYYLFYGVRGAHFTLHRECEGNFLRFPYKGTCISLDDFNETYSFDFRAPDYIDVVDVDGLISFCEYSYNLVIFLADNLNKRTAFIQQIKKVVEKANYKEIVNENGTVDFVPNEPKTIIASESVDDSNISYDILHYNHHSMKGNLKEKRKALTSFANYFEPKRMLLKNFNKDIENNLFCMFNEFSIRHEKEKKNALLAEATDEKLEEYYDLTYELCLTAFSILAGIESNEKVKEIRKKINK